MMSANRIFVMLCDTCALSHADMMSLRAKLIDVFHSKSNRRGNATLDTLATVLALAVALDAKLDNVLKLDALVIVSRSKQHDMRAIVEQCR